MAEARRLAAIDLGAESGRVVLGRFDGQRVSLEVSHRFANRPVWLPDGLHWDLLTLFADALDGLALAADRGRLDGIGVDAWGCDYALLDGEQRVLGLPFHYRDERVAPGIVERAHSRVGQAELYRRTGIQTMAINTVFQLIAEADGAAASVAERIGLIPDLIGLWLTGTLANEVTIASTTGLLEARGMGWAIDLVERLGLPSRPFAGEAVPPGFELGAVLEHHESAGAATGTPVRAVAGHDTASAFAAAPLSSRHAAVLSSGTWSLLGLEVDQPQLGDESAAFNVTNERGVDGTIRLLRNVMGLWLLQECRREWIAAGEAPEYDELIELANHAPPDVALFDPDHDSLLHRGGMPQRIAALCTDSGQDPPADKGELVRSILVSLACKYRLVLERLERIAGRRIEIVHVVGGGARNELLCQLTADLLGRDVLAGPSEATAMGNVLMQAWALGDLSSLAELRELAARSISPVRFEPDDAQPAEETYRRFLVVTGLAPNRPIGTAA